MKFNTGRENYIIITHIVVTFVATLQNTSQLTPKESQSDLAYSSSDFSEEQTNLHPC